MAQPQRQYPKTLEAPRTRTLRRTGVNRAYQAYRLLRVGFTLLPILAGADKFVHFLANWEQYLAPGISTRAPVSAETFMMGVGVVEIVAGLVVAMKPRLGGWLVAAWLCVIAVNLLMIPGHFDIVLRDLGLALGAVALARLARQFDPSNVN
jgi:hypothetical protein